MNLIKLKQAEAAFLQRYPGGFDNPEITAIRKKKHNVDKMVAFAQECFSKRNFKLPDLIVQNMVKVVSRSSIISVFEKSGFMDFANGLSREEQELLSSGLRALWQGSAHRGRATILDL